MSDTYLEKRRESAIADFILACGDMAPGTVLWILQGKKSLVPMILNPDWHAVWDYAKRQHWNFADYEDAAREIRTWRHKNGMGT